jgi:hypothetical protein
MASALIALRTEMAATQAEITKFTQELAELKAREPELMAAALAEAEEKARQAEAEASLLRTALAPPAPVKVTLPVFCTADEVGLRKKHMKISDFDHMIAFSYQVKKNLGEPFAVMSEPEFKKHLCSLTREDNGGEIKIGAATQMTTFMKTANAHIDKLIVVAVAGSKGGGLEIRRITGGYRYSEDFKLSDGRLCYFHQYPTEVVRKLTDEESKEVAAARKNCYALNWSVALAL